jgi:ADP-ribose pyrophosphatase YjhB (NUDIX family)
MTQRIRVVGIVRHDDKILLIEQQNTLGFRRWTMPGGRLEPEDTDLYAGAEREVFEETGLRVRAGKLRFISEYAGVHLNLFAISLAVECHLAEGESIDNINLSNTMPDDNIHNVRWWTRAELQEGIPTGYALSCDTFWDNLDTDTDVIHLGRQTEN